MDGLAGYCRERPSRFSPDRSIAEDAISRYATFGAGTGADVARDRRLRSTAILRDDDQVCRVHLDQLPEWNVVRLVGQELQTEGQQFGLERDF